MVCRVLVAGLLLHDEAHVLVGLRGALVVVQHLGDEADNECR